LLIGVAVRKGTQGQEGVEGVVVVVVLWCCGVVGLLWGCCGVVENMFFFRVIYGTGTNT